MSSIAAIRTAIKTTVEAAVSSLTVYDTMPDRINLPAVVVVPSASDFNVAMGRGADTHNFDLYVLTSKRETGLAQDDLDAFITGAGSASIRQVIFSARALGLSDADEHVVGMRGYGGSFSFADIDHVGAILEVVVHTSGTG